MKAFVCELLFLTALECPVLSDTLTTYDEMGEAQKEKVIDLDLAMTSEQIRRTFRGAEMRSVIKRPIWNLERMLSFTFSHDPSGIIHSMQPKGHL